MTHTSNDNARARLTCPGVSRVSDNDKAVMVSFSRSLTNGELRFFHEICGRSAPLIDGED